jgi:hypothetical protein
MRFFLTYNETYNGIFKSQVIDVLKNYNDLGFKIKLISIISVRNFLAERKKIKKEYHFSLVLPMFPFLRFWTVNRYFLRFFFKKSELIISRGIFATNLVFLTKLKNCKVIYDGRGAITSEQDEFGVYNGSGLENKIFKIEQKAILNSNYRISVSEKLLEYWKKDFLYNSKNHVIIPSCANYEIIKKDFAEEKINKEEIIIVFCGSSSKWHSFEIMVNHFEKFLKYSPKIKIIILSKINNHIIDLINKFPKRVSQDWVEPSKISNILIKADYGYVYRNQTRTNFVASPVKIAEYLSCGLKLLISDNLGDYSELVNENRFGFNLDNPFFNYSSLNKVCMSEKKRISSFAKKNLSFSSKKIRNNYLNLINENSFNK